ncbi:MAG: VOC family protein [Bacteroidota bacterium]
MPSHEFVPYLSIANADEAVAFYARVFEVEPYLRLDMPDGRVMHCEYRFDGGRFFLSAELPEHGGTPSPTKLGATSVAIHLYVENCDAMVEKMAANGAEILMEPTDMFYGERFARVRDPFGHEWGISTRFAELEPAEIKRLTAQMFSETSGD